MKSKCLQWATKDLSMRIVLKRTPLVLFQQKKAATGSSAGKQSGTHVPKGRGGGDLPKISAFPANAPQPRGQGSSQGDKSPTRTPRFSTNTGEGSASSAQGGRNRGPLNRHPPFKPPGTIKTATKDKTKLKEKNTPVEVLGVTEKISNYLPQNILLLLYVYKKLCWHHIRHKLLNPIQPIIKVVFMGMVVSAFLLKIASFITQFNFKLIYKL